MYLRHKTVLSRTNLRSVNTELRTNGGSKVCLLGTLVPLAAVACLDTASKQRKQQLVESSCLLNATDVSSRCRFLLQRCLQRTADLKLSRCLDLDSIVIKCGILTAIAGTCLTQAKQVL